MNGKRNPSPKKTPNATHPPCLCQGAGPVFSDVLRRLGPPEEARRHFQTARIEILKGLRALIDARIQHVSQSPDKGQKITVE